MRLILLLLLLATGAAAEPFRAATFNTGLAARGPGLMLRDLDGGDSARADAVIAIIAHLTPDILAVQSFDYDAGGAARGMFADRLAEAGHPMPHHTALRGNTGRPTAFDIDGDGWRGGPRDAQGYGEFAGHGGMAFFSRHPIVTEEIADFDDLLWADLPGALLPAGRDDGWPSGDLRAVQRLSSAGHWLIPVETEAGRLVVGLWHATPPVFDGPEDRNGLRNHDEAALWLRLLDGALPGLPEEPLILMGDANLDPDRGAGRPAAMRALLAHPALTDPLPPRPTTTWAPPPDGPGPLRVDYVLPDARLTVTGAGILAPGDAPGLPPAEDWPPHRPVWVDLDLFRGGGAAVDPAGGGG